MMNICQRCGKENQAHYKFCLGCGAPMPESSAGAKEAPIKIEQTSKKNEWVSAPMAAAPVPHEPTAPGANNPKASTSKITCPKCNAENEPNFKFCSSCGASLVASIKPPVETKSEDTVSSLLMQVKPDGSIGETMPLKHGLTIGRTATGPFVSDMFLSPKHATFSVQGKKVSVKDENSLNGVYYRLQAEEAVELKPGAVFRIGQEILRFDTLSEGTKKNNVEVHGSVREPALGKVSLVIGRQSVGNAFVIPKEGCHLGRERGNLLFPEDGYVSGLHCRIFHDGKSVKLMDLGSSNGTFMRIANDFNVSDGTLLLMGQQLLKVQLR